MTDLTDLTDLRTEARSGVAAAPLGRAGPARRPVTLGATAAGTMSAVAVLMACMALGVAGWFASDAGAHGDTRDALRVGADAWLLAHGARLQLASVTVTAVPLGLTGFCAFVLFRLGRWAGASSAVEDVRAAASGIACLAGSYGVVAIVTALLASHQEARPHLGLALLGAVALAVSFGGAGIVTGSGRWPVWRTRVPELWRALGTGAATAVLLMLVAGSLLVAVATLLDFGSAANVLARLHVDVPGGAFYSLLTAALSPNAALLGGAYLVGPGFTFGAGTLVSPGAVVLGPMPAFPVLAALPDEGVAPSWTVALATVPVVVGALAAGLMLRRFPVPKYEVGGLRGLASGALGGVLFTATAFLAGGSIGPGRMSEVGVLLTETLVAGASALAVGGLLGGLATTWWVRRRMLGR